jgi:hypothetical protein
VDISKLGEGIGGLGKALDETTDPLNELRNGIEGLGDRLVLFGGQGERLRNEIEEIRDPALRARVANEQWAVANTNLNGTLGKLGDRLQVAKIEAAGAVGGLDNLNRLAAAAALGVGVLVAGLIKLGGALIEVVGKGFAEYSATLKGYKEEAALAEAQTRSLYHEIGRGGDAVLSLKDKQDALRQSQANGADLLAALTDRYKELPGPVQDVTKGLVEGAIAYGTGNTWLLTLSASEKGLSRQQRDLSKAVRDTTEVLRSQTAATEQMDAAARQLGQTLGERAGGRAQRVNQELQVANKTYDEVTKLAKRRRGGGGGGGKKLGVLETVFGEGFLPQIDADGSAIKGGLDAVVEDIEKHRINDVKGGLAGGLAGIFGPGVQDGLSFMRDQMDVIGKTAERLADPFERFSDALGRGLAASQDFATQFGGAVAQTLQQTITSVTGAIGEGLGALLSGKADKSFKEWTAGLLGDVANMWGDLFIAQGAGMVFLNPIAGVGLLAAGAGLKGLGSLLGASSGGGGGGRSSGGGGSASVSRDVQRFSSSFERRQVSTGADQPVVLKVGEQEFTAYMSRQRRDDMRRGRVAA